MKVLFVSSGNSRYGIVSFIKSQGDSLKKEGVELEYFTIKGKGVIGYLRNIRPLRKFLKKNKFEIIHAHYGMIGLLCLLTFTRIPIVLSVMGDDAYGNFDVRGKRIKSSYIGMFLTQIALIFVKKVIVKSRNILNAIPQKKKCSVIPNGVDFDLFKPIDKDLNKNVVLFLANEENSRKNYKLFKDAMDIINRKELLIVNPYPIEHREFPDYLNKCTIFVLTSYNEGSPNVIKEAMACNIPIVSTDVGDVREIIGKTNGCFITSFEPNDVANKIEAALSYGKRTNGRENIKHLEISLVANNIINIYKEIIKE